MTSTTQQIQAGDRVRTSKGSGTVVEVDDSKARFAFPAAKVEMDGDGYHVPMRFDARTITLLAAQRHQPRGGGSTGMGCQDCGDAVPTIAGRCADCRGVI